MATLFKEMAGISELNPGVSVIHGREIPHKAHSDRAIWFDFRALCLVRVRKPITSIWPNIMNGVYQDWNA